MQHFHSCVISGFERGVNEICALLGFYAVPIGSFLPFRDDSGGEILTAVLVKIQVIWGVSHCRLVNLPSSSGPAAPDEATTFHRNVRNPSPVDRA
jgi:hypothetical protein